MQDARNIAKNILLFPYWVISIFTGAKYFGDNPVLGSRILNILGLHVFRVVLSHFIFHFKQKLFFSLTLPREDRKFFNEHGYLLKKNFLPAEDFKKLSKEILSYQGEMRDIIEGDTVTRRLNLTEDDSHKFPQFHSLTENKIFTRLMKYTSAKNEFPRSFVECIFQNRGQNRDPQKDFHRDTFHPTMKAWLFLDNVTEENGTFLHVPGSQKLTWKRLKWEYLISIRKTDGQKRQGSVNKKIYNKGGAFRITKDDLHALGYPKAKRMQVKKNTLVIANTFAFHKRGKATEVSRRRALWFSSRVHPFNPFPGLNSDYLRKMRDRVFYKYLKYSGAKNPEKINFVNKNFKEL